LTSCFGRNRVAWNAHLDGWLPRGIVDLGFIVYAWVIAKTVNGLFGGVVPRGKRWLTQQVAPNSMTIPFPHMHDNSRVSRLNHVARLLVRCVGGKGGGVNLLRPPSPPHQ